MWQAGLARSPVRPTGETHDPLGGSPVRGCMWGRTRPIGSHWGLGRVSRDFKGQGPDFDGGCGAQEGLGASRLCRQRQVAPGWRLLQPLPGRLRQRLLHKGSRLSEGRVQASSGRLVASIGLYLGRGNCKDLLAAIGGRGGS